MDKKVQAWKASVFEKLKFEKLPCNLEDEYKQLLLFLSLFKFIRIIYLIKEGKRISLSKKKVFDILITSSDWGKTAWFLVYFVWFNSEPTF